MSTNRRDFLVQISALATALGARSATQTVGAEPQHSAPRRAPVLPWYRRTLRWGQTNITEIDPARYDIAWWREYWKRTEIQGVIINAGGIVAYYPSRFPLQYRPPALGDRDLLGELTSAAHADGLAVLARMDSSRVHEPLYRAHPDWIAVDDKGQPYRNGDLFVTCVNGPYYREYLPDVLREIIGRSHPEGFTDNSWSGLDRGSICYCANCARIFRDTRGLALPRQRDWGDASYRQWIEWNYARRIELWDFNNTVTRGAGGTDCLWIGMNGGGITGQSRNFRDYRQICARAPIIMLDHQTRSDTEGFQHNAFTGKLIHGMLGWDKLIPESMPMYQIGSPMFRLATKPPAEARMWMLAGFAGGIQPWWHHVGAYHDDRRMYRTAAPVMQWHKTNERFLVARTPVASVGVVWSQRNVDFYGRDFPEQLVEMPLRGWTQALVRARIPHVPVHADQIESAARDLAVLILPNLASMSDAQLASVRTFVERGGALIATGQTSLFDEWGDQRADFGLADLLGVKGATVAQNARTASERLRRTSAEQTYLRLAPELRARVNGPHSGDEPAITGGRHPVLAGFDETDILPYGGTLDALTVDAGAKVLLTFVPAFPAFPPESAWMRQPRTDVPGLILNETSTARIAFLPADIDRRFAIDNMPDHGDLLANLVRWAARDTIPLHVSGAGLLDCELYQQPGRLILHVVNLTSAGSWRAPVDELIPVGPLNISVRLPAGFRPRAVRRLVAERTEPGVVRAGSLHFVLDAVLDHEVVVLE